MVSPNRIHGFWKGIQVAAFCAVFAFSAASFASDLDGADGANGGVGDSGTSGAKITTTIASQADISGISWNNDGMIGNNGGNGTNGGAGLSADSLTGYIDGGNGGRGGDGGRGGHGGGGGAVVLTLNSTSETLLDFSGTTHFGGNGVMGKSGGRAGFSGEGGQGNFAGVDVQAGAGGVGGFGAAGGGGGNGGAGGSVTLTFQSGNFKFANDTVWGGDGGNGSNGESGTDGSTGGNGGVGLLAGDFVGGNGGNGGDGGSGGDGGRGGDGGNAILTFDNALTEISITFESHTFGGDGGNGGNGVAGGNGGNGGIGGDGGASPGPIPPPTDPGYGGTGGNGGHGGNGGDGGDGGDALLTVERGTLVFNSAQFGGDGGMSGVGGAGGHGGNGGLGGGANTQFNGINGFDGNDGYNGSSGFGGDGVLIVHGGNVSLTGITQFGGDGGLGGDGNLTIDGGTVTISGTTRFGGNNYGSSGYGDGEVLLNGGTLVLNGDMTFNGTKNAMTVGSEGTLVYSGNHTIDMNRTATSDGTVFTFEAGSTLRRSDDSGILSIIADTVVGPDGDGTVTLALTGSGDFLSIEATANGLTEDMFSWSGYRPGTMVVESGGVYTFIVGEDPQTLEWTGAGNATWQAGQGKGGGNWDGGDDFYNADTAEFNGKGTGTVQLVGAITPKEVNILAGNYDFVGDGYFENGKLNLGGSALVSLGNNRENYFNQVNIGGYDGDASSLTLTGQTQLADTQITVGFGGVLEVTAATEADDAPIQGGSLVLDDGGTLKTNFLDYTGMRVGDTKEVVVAQDVAYENEDGATQPVGGRLYDVSDLLWKPDSEGRGNLTYILTRLRSEFKYVTPGINDLYDSYASGNDFIDYTLLLQDDLLTETTVQSGFDIANLGAGASIVNSTANRVVDTLRKQTRREYSCSPGAATMRCQAPCAPVGPCDRIGSPWHNGFVSRNYWVDALYMNNRGFGLRSAGFRNGFVNDQYGFVFGMDVAALRDRIGIAGVAGWGNTVNRGDLFRTTNETTFGGVNLYYSTQWGAVDMVTTVGWLGMDNSMKQLSGPETLSGSQNNGIVSFSFDLERPYRYGSLLLTPLLGVQYNHYYQDGTDFTWGEQNVLRSENATGDMVMIPVGVKLANEICRGNHHFVQEFRARYIANVGDIDTGYNVWATGASVPVMMSSAIADRDIGDIDLALKWRNRFVEFNLAYGYMFSKHYQTQNFSGGFRFTY